MEKKQIIEIIAKDAQEVNKLTQSFIGYHDISPIYLDLTLAKVKHLYAELLLLRNQGHDLTMKHVEKLLNEKQETKSTYKQQSNENQHQTPTTTEKKPPEETESPQETLNKKREEHFLATQLKHDPIDDIKKAINLNEKIWFIKELFNGDIDTYNNTLAELNQFKYLEQALDFLDKYFDWDYDNQTVRDFMEFVYRRFIQQ